MSSAEKMQLSRNRQFTGYKTVDQKQLEEIMRTPVNDGPKRTGTRAKLRQSQNLQKILKMDFEEKSKSKKSLEPQLIPQEQKSSGLIKNDSQKWIQIHPKVSLMDERVFVENQRTPQKANLLKVDNITNPKQKVKRNFKIKKYHCAISSTFEVPKRYNSKSPPRYQNIPPTANPTTHESARYSNESQ